MSEQTNALHLARSRILELEEALRKCLKQLEQLAPVHGRVHDEREAIAAARSVLNKENGNGDVASSDRGQQK